MYEETSNHYFIVSSLCVLCCILFSTFTYCGNCGSSTHQLLFHGRVKLSIQTVKSWLSYVDEQKYSSVSHQLKIIKDKHQSFKQEIRFGKKGKTAQFWMSYLDNITFMLTFNRIVLKLAWMLGNIFCHFILLWIS